MLTFRNIPGPFERIVLIAERIAHSRLGEFFDSEHISELPDGKLRIEAFFPVDEWVLSFIMSLPGSVRVIEPETMRTAISERAQAFMRENEAESVAENP